MSNNKTNKHKTPQKTKHKKQDKSAWKSRYSLLIIPILLFFADSQLLAGKLVHQRLNLNTNPQTQSQVQFKVKEKSELHTLRVDTASQLLQLNIVILSKDGYEVARLTENTNHRGVRRVEFRPPSNGAYSLKIKTKDKSGNLDLEIRTNDNRIIRYLLDNLNF